MADLLDVDIVFPFLHPRHRQMPRVLAWLAGKQEPGSLLICRVVPMGVLRLQTQPGVMSEDLMTPVEFLEGWDRLPEDDRFILIEEEPAGLERRWRTICSASPRARSRRSTPISPPPPSRADTPLRASIGGFA